MYDVSLYHFDGINVTCVPMMNFGDENFCLRGTSKDSLCMEIRFLANLIKIQFLKIETLNIDYQYTDSDLDILIDDLLVSSKHLYTLTSQNTYNISLIHNVSNNVKALSAFAHDHLDIIEDAFATEMHLFYDTALVIALGIICSGVSTAVFYHFVADQQLMLAHVGVANAAILGLMTVIYQKIQYDNAAIHKIEYIAHMFDDKIEPLLIGIEKQLYDEDN